MIAKHCWFTSLCSGNMHRILFLRVDRVLYHFHATDPRDNREKSIITMVTYDEVVNGRMS